MKDKVGEVFSIANDNPPVPGCTISKEVHGGENYITYFSLARNTDISAEIYPYHKLLIVADGSMEVYGNGGLQKKLEAGDSIVTYTDTPIGMKSSEGAVYNMTWVGTIIHETTHVRDYIDYAQLISATDYEDILSINKNLPFQLWTEFNARARGYYFVRKYTFENMFDEAQVNDIIQIELPGQEDLLYKNYHQTSDGVQQAYYVSHFLGRLYTLQEVFPNYFSDEWIEAYPLFENNEWMYKWYLFLKRNADLKSAFENFDEMKAILRQNFAWI